MRLRFVVAAMAMCALGYALASPGLFGQGRGQAPATGTLAHRGAQRLCHARRH